MHCLNIVLKSSVRPLCKPVELIFRMSERDTHFQGYAEFVARKLKEEDLLNINNHVKPLVDPPYDFDYERVKQIIARYAYDLAKHSAGALAPFIYVLDPAEFDPMDHIPDLIE